MNEEPVAMLSGLTEPARNQQMQGRSGQLQSTSAAFGYRHLRRHAAAVGNGPSSAVAGVLLPDRDSMGIATAGSPGSPIDGAVDWLAAGASIT